MRAYLDSDAAFPDLDSAEATYFANGGVVLGTFEDGRLVGTGALARIDDGLGELRRMFLLADYRGRGLGRRMAEVLVEFAREAGYRRIRLGSNKRLTASHALYRKLGFKDIPSYEPGGELHAVYMQLDLG